MSLIEQARELVKGFVSTEVDPAGSAAAVVDQLRDEGDAERIRQEWDAQPNHP